MAATCRICGQTIEMPEPLEGPPPLEHARCHEIEPTYQSDLRGLIALARSRAKPLEPSADDDVGLDAPPSVREAIRLAGALLPAPLPARLAPLRVAHRRRSVLAALPIAAVVVTGVAIGATLASRHGAAAPALPLSAVSEYLAQPAVVEPFVPLAAETSAPPAPAPPPSSRVPAPAPAPAPTPVPPPKPSPPRPAPAAVARPHAPAPATPPPPVTTAPPDPPSLMQAIKDAVHAPPKSAAPGSLPSASP
jgi:hypothetical protein